MMGSQTFAGVACSRLKLRVPPEGALLAAAALLAPPSLVPLRLLFLHVVGPPNVSQFRCGPNPSYGELMSEEGTSDSTKIQSIAEFLSSKDCDPADQGECLLMDTGLEGSLWTILSL